MRKKNKKNRPLENIGDLGIKDYGKHIKRVGGLDRGSFYRPNPKARWHRFMSPVGYCISDLDIRCRTCGGIIKAHEPFYLGHADWGPVYNHWNQPIHYHCPQADLGHKERRE